MKKTLREFITQYAKDNNFGTSEQDLFESLEYSFDRVARDEEDMHRWYTYWRYVIKINIDEEDRYFAIQVMECKGEDSSPEDCGFEASVDNAREVYPVVVESVKYL